MSSKQHERKLAAAIKQMGTSLATHPRSTFTLSHAGSATLAEFKGLRAAARLSGLLAKPKSKPAERYDIDRNTAKVTKLRERKAG